MKKSIIIANWKCNPTTLKEAKKLFSSVAKGIKKGYSILSQKVEILICPPFVYLSALNNLVKSSCKIYLGAQNLFWEEKGAFTGEVSPLMLKDLGCSYAIIGHSERRKMGENDEMINKKIKAALGTGLNPILCVGETESDRKAGKTFKKLKEQLQKGLKGVRNLIVAYEPVWAIGTGKNCEPQDAKKILQFLRKNCFADRIIYGGSVNAENIKNYLRCGFNGVLVGGASLRAKDFLTIIKNAN